MFEVVNSSGSPTMTRNENKPSIAAVKELMGVNHDALRKIVQDLLQVLSPKSPLSISRHRRERHTVVRRGGDVGGRL